MKVEGLVLFLGSRVSSLGGASSYHPPSPQRFISNFGFKVLFRSPGDAPSYRPPLSGTMLVITTLGELNPEAYPQPKPMIACTRASLFVISYDIRRTKP